MADIKIDSDSGKFKAGADQDLEIYNDGSHSYISGVTASHNMVFATRPSGGATTTAVTIDSDGNVTMNGNLTVNKAITFNETSVDADFRVESNGNANMLFVDGGNDRVGIGTGTPDHHLEITTDSADTTVAISAHHNTDATVPKLVFKKSAGTEASPGIVADGEALGKIEWYGYNTNGSTYDLGGYMHMKVDAGVGDTGGDETSDMPTQWILALSPNGTAVPTTRINMLSSGAMHFYKSDGSTSQLSIDGSGNVGVGAIINDFTPTLGVTGAQPGLVLNDSATEAFLVAYCDGDASVMMYDHNDSFIIKQAESVGGSSAADVLKLDSSKNATFSGNVTISKSETADAWLTYIHNTQTSDGGVQHGLAVRAGVNSDDKAFQVKKGSDDSSMFLIKGDGTSTFSSNVGIGTGGNNDRLLHVQGGASSNTGVIKIEGGQPWLEMQSSANTWAMYVGDAGGGDFYIRDGDSTGGSDYVTINAGDGNTEFAGEVTADNFKTPSGHKFYSAGAAYLDSGSGAAVQLRAEGNGAKSLTIASDGAATFTHAVSKASGSFKIDHPLPSKKDTHYLVHSFTESPRADLIYRDKVKLVNGSATINIDVVAGMTEGTFVLLCDDVQCFTSNESDWKAVKGSVTGNILTIECEDSNSTADVAWMVIGDRKDNHILETPWTDENGKPIIEPEKENA